MIVDQLHNFLTTISHLEFFWLDCYRNLFACQESFSVCRINMQVAHTQSIPDVNVTRSSGSATSLVTARCTLNGEEHEGELGREKKGLQGITYLNP